VNWDRGVQSSGRAYRGRCTGSGCRLWRGIFLVDTGTGLELGRIKPGYGTPLPSLHLHDADEQLEGGLERLVGVDEDAGLLAQVLDPSVELGELELVLVWVQSLLRAAMGCAQARLVRTRASGRCQSWRRAASTTLVLIASAKHLAAMEISGPARHHQGRKPGSPEPCAGLGSGQG